jgi:hypothetical protein
MARATQLIVSLTSKPGVLAQLTKTLADAGVNIASLSADSVSGRGKIRVIVSDPPRPGACCGARSIASARSPRSSCGCATVRERSRASLASWRRSG